MKKFKFWGSSAFGWTLVGWSVALAYSDVFNFLRTGQWWYLAFVAVFVALAVFSVVFSRKHTQAEWDIAYHEGRYTGIRQVEVANARRR